MKYITSVKDNDGIKHIVEAGGLNQAVLELTKSESYGNRSGEHTFLTNGVRVTKDFHVKNDDSGHDFMHLAKIVFAIELVRFVTIHLSRNE